MTTEPARPDEVVGIVLAGGRASRFGGSKLAAPVDGRPLLHVAVDAVLQVAPLVIVVGPRDGEVDVPTDDRVAVVRDERPHPGPLAAVATALQVTSGDLALVVGGDMPRLQPAVLTALVTALRSDGSASAAILGTAEGRRQTLPAALRVAPARAATHRILQRGGASLRDLLAALSTVELPSAAWRPLDPAGATLLDVDRPEDLARLRPRA